MMILTNSFMYVTFGVIDDEEFIITNKRGVSDEEFVRNSEIKRVIIVIRNMKETTRQTPSYMTRKDSSIIRE